MYTSYPVFTPYRPVYPVYQPWPIAMPAPSLPKPEIKPVKSEPEAVVEAKHPAPTLTPQEAAREKWVSLFRTALETHPDLQKKLDDIVTPGMLAQLNQVKTPEDLLKVGLETPAGKKMITQLKNQSRILRLSFRHVLNNLIPEKYANILNHSIKGDSA